MKIIFYQMFMACTCLRRTGSGYSHWVDQSASIKMWVKWSYWLIQSLLVSSSALTSTSINVPDTHACTHTHTCICTHTHTHVHAHTHTRACTHTHTRACTHTHMHMHTHTHTHVHAHTHTHPLFKTVAWKKLHSFSNFVFKLYSQRLIANSHLNWPQKPFCFTSMWTICTLHLVL